jgi:putative acetyltransferase
LRDAREQAQRQWTGRAMTQFGCLPEIRRQGLSQAQILGILSIWGREWGKEIVGRRCMSDSDFIFRPATNGDAPILRNMIYDVLAEYGLAPDPGGTDADLSDIDAHYHRRGGMFDVLIAPVGVIVGSVALDPREEGVAELRKMYLRKSMRGKGLGRLLLEHALQRAKGMGLKKIVLETATVLKEAMAMYERYGFKTSPAPIHSRRCDCVMELDLENDACDKA